MRNAELPQQACEGERVLQPLHLIGRGAQNRVARRDRAHQRRGMLEARAEHDRQPRRRVRRKRFDQRFPVESQSSPAGVGPHRERGVLPRVGVREQVDAKRPQPGPPGGSRKRPGRQRDDREVEGFRP
ncbi:hypothetical protein [Methylopila sp. M107]|uniref:hypothetical protein n=1 Tax=Methylopila sp. M107 TaxID=1101190 RepID=UPI00058DBFD0|nr:hypothetical protein [Methylopila sp. M107]